MDQNQELAEGLAAMLAVATKEGILHSQAVIKETFYEHPDARFSLLVTLGALQSAKAAVMMAAADQMKLSPEHVRQLEKHISRSTLLFHMSTGESFKDLPRYFPEERLDDALKTYVEQAAKQDPAAKARADAVLGKIEDAVKRHQK